MSYWWKRLQHLQMSKKFKTFAWHVCHNSLPIRQKLSHKIVIVDDKCPVCAQEIEDINHALLTCLSLELMWYNGVLDFDNLRDTSEPKDLLNNTQWIKRSEELEKIFIIAQSLWKQRNKKVFDNVLTHPDLDIDQTLSLLANFKTKQAYKAKKKLSQINIPWQTPPIGTLKLNVDGAIFVDQQCIGIRCVL